MFQNHMGRCAAQRTDRMPSAEVRALSRPPKTSGIALRRLPVAPAPAAVPWAKALITPGVPLTAPGRKT